MILKIMLKYEKVCDNWELSDNRDNNRDIYFSVSWMHKATCYEEVILCVEMKVYPAK